jgi:hypothetical protein
MNLKYKRWQKLFFWCLGIFIASAFCMKWMEPDLVSGGRSFTVIGLEITYTKQELAAILGGLDDTVKAILRYHLSFDFMFMAGVYPGIAALCMMGREKAASKTLKKILGALAVLQLLAWGCDIFENVCLLTWIKDPIIGNEFGYYHVIVWTKWILALTGALVSIPVCLKRKKNKILILSS